MTTIYMCDICGKTYSHAGAVKVCEISHDDSLNRRKAHLIKMEYLDPCNYCARAYYVYGCERNCGCEKNCNDYSLFIPED